MLAIQAPTTGPTVLPTMEPVCSSARERPMARVGVLVAMSACEAGMKPLVVPRKT